MEVKDLSQAELLRMVAMLQNEIASKGTDADRAITDINRHIVQYKFVAFPCTVYRAQETPKAGQIDCRGFDSRVAANAQALAELEADGWSPDLHALMVQAAAAVPDAGEVTGDGPAPTAASVTKARKPKSS